MDYISMGELLAMEKDARCMDVYDAREEKTARRKEKLSEIKEGINHRLHRFRSFFKWISKKAVFITSVPFYWFIIFRYIVGLLDTNLFIFVTIASFAMSFFYSEWGWGLLNGLGKMF